jgi:hypothetical protein
MGERSFAAELFERDPGLRETVAGSTLLDRLRTRATKVDVDGQRYHVVEGDLLLDDAELELYAGQQEALFNQWQARSRAQQFGFAPLIDDQPAALVGMTIGGQIVRWREGMILTYCVLKATFLSEDEYRTVVTNMQQATDEWEAVCGIDFEYQPQFDGHQGTDNPGVLFTVRGFNAAGKFFAASFFPTDPVFKRWVLIDPTYFGDHEYDKVGVIRHELGHALGFRHEHIRPNAPPGCPDEDAIYEGTVALDLTPYDPKSVMHYFCGGRGSRSLALTDIDREGAQRVYGSPRATTRFVG